MIDYWEAKAFLIGPQLSASTAPANCLDVWHVMTSEQRHYQCPSCCSLDGLRGVRWYHRAIPLGRLPHVG